ncbi:hypothetical protein LEN26_001650, partial [Aphanomyces euteiches]
TGQLPDNHHPNLHHQASIHAENAAQTRLQASIELPSKIIEIANDPNYVFLPKDQIWHNKEVMLLYTRSETIKDYVFGDVNRAEKYEAF